eukprot:3778191-Rhodomonas_salina.1
MAGQRRDSLGAVHAHRHARVEEAARNLRPRWCERGWVVWAVGVMQLEARWSRGSHGARKGIRPPRASGGGADAVRHGINR